MPSHAMETGVQLIALLSISTQPGLAHTQFFKACYRRDRTCRHNSKHFQQLFFVVVDLVFLCLHETHSLLFFSFSVSIIWNIGEFRAKNCFTDDRTAITIHSSRDSVLKMHDCYQDMQIYSATFYYYPSNTRRLQCVM